MRALSLDPDLALREMDSPTPGPGEALVRVRAAGVCNTDLELVRGYMDFRGVLGHEMVGEVVQCDDDASLVGKRVNAEINLGCGRCERCLGGMPRHCATRTVFGILGKDGCFAEYATLPVQNLVPIPDEVDDVAAVFTEPLAAAFEILEQVHLLPTDRVLVLGDGKLGLLVAMALAQTGAELHVLGKHDNKLAIAKAVGARVWALPDRPSGQFDVVVEATGSPSGLAAAVEFTRPRGTLVLKSTFHGTTELALAPLVIHELTLVGSRCGRFEPAQRAMASGRVDPRPLLSEQMGLADGMRAMEHAASAGVLKVVLHADDA